MNRKSFIIFFVLITNVAAITHAEVKLEANQELPLAIDRFILLDKSKISIEEYSDRANDIAQVILNLSVEEFNSLVFYYLNRYHDHTNERASIYFLFTKVGFLLLPELDKIKNDSVAEHAVEGALWGSAAVITGRIFSKIFSKRWKLIQNFGKAIFSKSSRKALGPLNQSKAISLAKSRPWAWMAAGTGLGAAMGSLDGIYSLWWETKKIDPRFSLGLLQNYIVLKEVALEACLWRWRTNQEFVERNSDWELAVLRLQEIEKWLGEMSAWISQVPLLVVSREIDFIEVTKILAPQRESNFIRERLSEHKRKITGNGSEKEICKIPETTVEIAWEPIDRDIQIARQILERVLENR